MERPSLTVHGPCGCLGVRSIVSRRLVFLQRLMEVDNARRGSSRYPTLAAQESQEHTDHVRRATIESMETGACSVLKRVSKIHSSVNIWEDWKVFREADASPPFTH